MLKIRVKNKQVKVNNTIVKSYVYGDCEWRDLLTVYNGQSITYDQIGNPLQYRDGMNLGWENGRCLTTISKNGDNINYAYDSDGYRISKNVNGVATEYYWLEGCLLGQKCGNETILFLYDDVGIIDGNGMQVVEYAYSAWGALLSITGSMADSIGQKNPLRYRGYYYDDETGSYYLLSRYYDAEVGRFLNTDGIIDNRKSTSHNLFAYCLNNPIAYYDVAGAWTMGISIGASGGRY